MFVFLLSLRNLLRTTKASQLESTNDTASNNTFLGKEDKDFDFDDLSPIKVEFVETTALQGDDEKLSDLEFLENWLIQIA